MQRVEEGDTPQEPDLEPTPPMEEEMAAAAAMETQDPEQTGAMVEAG